MKPLVSIIIPVYNSEKYISETIHSCLDQSYSELEIILVDDHSRDGSWELLTSFQRKFSDKIQIYKNDKKGAQSARNFGFRKSSGKYIQWLDSDDILGREKLSKQLIVLQASSNDVAFCGWAYFQASPNDAIPRPNKVWKNYNNGLKLLKDSWGGGGMILNSCWLIPREIAGKCIWDENLLKNQDGHYFFQALLLCRKAQFVQDCLVYYRNPSTGNISRRKDHNALKSLLYTYNYYEKVLEIENSKEMKLALGANYLNFIAHVYPKHKDLSKEADLHFKRLELRTAPLIGGKKFRIAQKFFGFYPALLFSQILHSQNPSKN